MTDVYKPSVQQQGFFDWVRNGRGSTLLTAVAGSGKSTTIVRSLLQIDERSSVVVLAFNATIAAEMKEKIEKLSKETGRAFARVSARTFHSLGFSAVCKYLGATKPVVDGSKCRKLYKNKVNEETYKLYGAFVPKLVSLAKGYGMGCLVYDEPSAWYDLIERHDLSLDSEEADLEKAIDHASKLLQLSNRVAEEGTIDFDDQLYLPVLWALKFWGNDWVFIDEAQDTNPIRRAIAKMALRVGGRLAAVGDRNQAIYMFTGASADAMDIIKREHNAIELPLTVSYRCPKVAESIVQKLVPHFSAHEAAPQGSILNLDVKSALVRLGNKDVVICRNTAPLVELAFKIIADGRGCVVLGKDIGEGLINLIKQQHAQGVDGLVTKLETYRDKEVAAYTAKGEDQKAEAVTDRVACILTVIGNLNGKDKTVPKLIARIESMFEDKSNVLTLCTAHKSKGKEWSRVAILEPELMPSKWARSDEAYQQELNLQYVSWTRFQEELIFMDGNEEGEEETATSKEPVAGGVYN